MSISRDADALLRRLHQRLIIDGQDVHPEDALSRDIQSYFQAPETKTDWPKFAQDALAGDFEAMHRRIEEIGKTPDASPQGIPVVFNSGGDVVWTAVEVRPGWWRIKEWGRSMMGDMTAEYFWESFTKAEQ